MKGLYGLLSESAWKYPNRPFVQYKDKAWTYREVDSLAIAISEKLLGSGVQKGDRVIILFDNSIQYIAAFFGTMRVNAVAVPVNPIKMTESILYIIEKCTPKLILTRDTSYEKLVKVGAEILADIINIDQIDIFNDQDNIIDSVQTLDVDEQDVAEILFTSGTTTNPKGVTLTHGNLMANTEAIVRYLKLNCGDSVLMTLPFTYSYGNSVLLTHAYAGAAVIIENSSAFPYKVLEAIKMNGVTGFSTVGSYANLLLKCIRNSDKDEKQFESLRYITFAGEATNNADIRFINRNYPDIEVYVMYGQTEASARLSYLSPELLGSKLGSIGKGLCNVELKVVNEAGADVKPGEVGEIIAHGPNIMKGYWEDPQATEGVLKDGWLYTGDSATVDEGGYIYIKGRKTDMIKHIGHRISPVEIESVINSCSYIKECAVVESILDQIPVIKAFIVLDKECQIDEIRKYANSKLPGFMRPHIFEVIDQLPKTDTGKIKRSILRSWQCVV